MKGKFVRKTVMAGSASLALLVAMGMGVLAREAMPEDAGVVVEENENSKTGYTATFKYYNEDAAKVQIKGGFQFYYDEDEKVYCGGINLEEGDAVENYLVNPEDWEKGKGLVHGGDEGYIADMTKDEESGAWTYSVDLPGGYYLYVYQVFEDAQDTENYEVVTDPVNLPACNELGAKQVRSQFYVPYDSEKQDPADDWSWCQPAEKEEDRGSLEGFTYAGVDGDQNAEIYLPAGYDADRVEPYKVLYLSHGGGGDEGDWFYQGHAGKIVDRLTAEGACEPFIMVTMNNAVYPSGGWWIEWEAEKYTDNIMNHLIPYVEANYNVSKDAKDRAFAGLSSGAVVTGNLLVSNPSDFAYFGLFSCSATYAWPELEDYSAYDDVNIYLSGGWADYCVNDKENYGSDEDVMVVSFAEKLGACGVTYNAGNGTKIVPGMHDWFNWPQVIRDYVTTTLWK